MRGQLENPQHCQATFDSEQDRLYSWICHGGRHAVDRSLLTTLQILVDKRCEVGDFHNFMDTRHTSAPIMDSAQETPQLTFNR